MTRDPTTKRQVPDPAKFPSGISAVATQLHNMGLKMGIYRLDTYLILAVFAAIHQPLWIATPARRPALVSLARLATKQ
jgi:hypothetical protein